MRISRALLVLMVALCCGLSAGSTQAEPEPAPEPAAAVEDQFAKARERFQEQDYEAALPLFRQVLEQTGSPNARLYVARCLKGLGDLAEAYDQMAETVKDATKMAESEPKYQPTRNVAAVHLATLEPLVGKLVVTLGESATGAKVTLDGQELAPEKIGTPVTRVAGPVTIAASAPGKQPWERKLKIPGGGMETVTVTLAAIPGPAPPDGGETAGGGVRVAGYVIAAVGVAGMVTLLVTGLMAQDKVDTMEEECGGVRCTDLRYGEVVDDARTLQTVANVSLVVGIAGIVGGTAMILFGGPTETQTAWLDISPAGSVVHYRLRF